MKQFNLNQLLIMSAKHALQHQDANGSFPAGHNGPYHDPETPVRNTSHYLYLLSSLYKATGLTLYKNAGERAANYLISQKAKQKRGSFHCRNKSGKDKCNGIIGQAWVIEALIKASEAFGRQDCYNHAEELFLLHPWDQNIGIWQIVEVDGTVLSYDVTFNHQLWFAATGSLLTNTPIARQRAQIFLDKVAKNVNIYPDGVIFHLSSMGSVADYVKAGIKPFLRELRSRFRKQSMRNQLYLKSVGYQGFNLYAFAMLKKAFPDAGIWKTDNFKKLLAAHRNEHFIRNIKNSEFGFYYNLTGIEIAYAVETFLHDKQEANIWLNRQFDETFLDETHPLARNCLDTNTALARIYQAVRLKGDYTVLYG